MIWIVSAYIIGFCIYQLFGITDSVIWEIYYDVLMFGSMLAVCVNRYFYGKYRFIWFIFGIVFKILIFIRISQITMKHNEFEVLNCLSEPYYLMPVLFILLLISVLIYKKWLN